MKKSVRWIALLAAVLTVFSLSACKEKTPDSSDGRPPLEKEFKELYDGALEGYHMFFLESLASTGTPISIGGVPGYCQVTDERFSSVEDLYSYLTQYFTEDYVNTYLLSEASQLYVDHNGALYVQPYKYDNPYYAGHIFYLTSRTDTEIQLRATVLSCVYEFTGEPFYVMPDTVENLTSRTAKFTITKTEAGWRFSSFSGLLI